MGGWEEAKGVQDNIKIIVMIQSICHNHDKTEKVMMVLVAT